MKTFLFLPIILLSSHLVGSNAFCLETEHSALSEICYVNSNEVLLYKIINWWNNSLPEDDTLPCGDLITCQHTGGITVDYNRATMMLHITTSENFGELISVFKQCEQCPGPAYLECSWLNTKFFDNVQATRSKDIKMLSFKEISPHQADKLKDAEKDLAVVVEGVIGGLLSGNGKIALHHTGDFLKSCPKSSQRPEERFPTSLKIINSRTQEELARYHVVFAHNSP